MTIRLFLPALALAALPALAPAQTCLGNPSFASGPINVSLSSSLDGNGYGVGLGSNQGWWSGRLITGIGGAWDSYRNPTETRREISGLIGTQRRTEDILEFCPFVSGRYETGSEIALSGGGRGSARLRGFSAGLGFGAQLAADRYVSIVPFGIVRLTDVRGKYVGDADTEDLDVGQTAGVFSFGLGFRFDEWLQLSPSVTVSSFAGSDLVIGLRGSMALRPR